MGLDASSNAGKAQASATAFNNQAASGYQNLQNIAQGIQTPQNANITQLLGQYGQLTGISGLGQSAGQGGYGKPLAGGNQITVGGQPQGQQAGGPQTFGQQQDAYKQSVFQQNQAAQNSPYALNQSQQQYLNQRLDTIARQQQTDVGTLQADLAKRGITDPRALNAATQQLQEHYQGLSQQVSTDYYNQIAQQKQQEIAGLLSTFTGLQGEAAQGLGSLGGAQQNTALAQQNLANQQQGGFLNLLGFGLGGGFGKAAGTSPVPSTAPIGSPSFGGVSFPTSGTADALGGAGVGGSGFNIYGNLGF